MKKSKTLAFFIVGVLVVVLAAAGCAAPAPEPAPAPTTTVTAPAATVTAPAATVTAPAATTTITAEPLPPGLPTVTWQIISAGHSFEDTQAIPYVKLADAVRTRTDGKFDIKITFEGELGIKRDGFVRALSTGVLDGSMMASGFGETSYPHVGALNLPYLFSNSDEARTGQAAIRSISEEEYAKDGIMLLTDHVWVAQELFTDQAISDVTNLDGLKIRGWSAIMLEWVKLAGGVPLSMPSGEVYVAIQRGVANGGITGSASAISASWYEVAPYAHLIHFFYVITDVTISKASFDALPKEYQDILLEEGRNFTENFKTQLAEEDASAWGIWKSNGGEVIELTPEQAATLKTMSTPLWDTWLEKATPEGKVAFAAIKNALGF